MSTFLSLFSLSHIWSELSRTIRRFPFSSGFVIIATAILLYLTHDNYLISQDISQILYRIVIVSVVTFFLSTGVALALESYPPQRGGLVSLTPWILVVIVAWGLYSALGSQPFDSIDEVTRIFLKFFCFFAFLFFSPFLGKWAGYRESGYVEYFTTMTLIISMSGVVGGAFMALGAIALASTDALFDVTWINSNTYSSLAVIAFVFFAPLFGLARIPSAQDIMTVKDERNVFFTFLVKYIGLPFIALYFLILYAYSVKVLMHFSDWPNGQVAWMVIGFSVFGYVLYIFSHALASSVPLIATLRKYFPLVVLPQVGMLFYAISLRIMQYDLTINRYFVVVFGLWLTGVSLYYIFAKNARLIIIPTSLAIISLIISVGPWSVYQYPLARQSERLLEDLTTAGIYRDGEIVPLPSYDAIDPVLAQSIYSRIEYVCSYAHCEAIRSLFAPQLVSLYAEKQARWEASEAKYQKCMLSTDVGACYREESTKEPSTYEVLAGVADAIRVSRSPYQQYPESPLIYTFAREKSIFPIDVQGYDLMIPIVSHQSLVGGDTGDHFIYYLDTSRGEFSQSGRVIETYTLDQIDAHLLDHRKAWLSQSDTTTRLPSADLTFALTGSRADIRLYIQSIDIKNPEHIGAYVYPSVEGYALVKWK